MNFWTKVTTGSFLVASMMTVSACRTTTAEQQEASLKDGTSDSTVLLNHRYVRVDRNYSDSFPATGSQYTDGIRLEMTRTLGCDLEPYSIRIAYNNGDVHYMEKSGGSADSSLWTRFQPRPIGLPRPSGGGSLPLGMPSQPDDDVRPVGMPVQPDVSRPVGLPMPADTDVRPQGLPMPSDDDTRPVGMPVQPDHPRPIGLPMPISITDFTISFDRDAAQARGCYVRIYDFDADSVRPVGLPMPGGNGDEVRPVGLPMPSDDNSPRPVGLPMPSDDSEPRPVGMPVGW